MNAPRQARPGAPGDRRGAHHLGPLKPSDASRGVRERIDEVDEGAHRGCRSRGCSRAARILAMVLGPTTGTPLSGSRAGDPRGYPHRQLGDQRVVPSCDRLADHLGYGVDPLLSPLAVERGVRDETSRVPTSGPSGGELDARAGVVAEAIEQACPPVVDDGALTPSSGRPLHTTRGGPGLRRENRRRGQDADSLSAMFISFRSCVRVAFAFASRAM